MKTRRAAAWQKNNLPAGSQTISGKKMIDVWRRLFFIIL
jgi:hypothetical protein